MEVKFIFYGLNRTTKFQTKLEKLLNAMKWFHRKHSSGIRKKRKKALKIQETFLNQANIQNKQQSKMS